MRPNCAAIFGLEEVAPVLKLRRIARDVQRRVVELRLQYTDCRGIQIAIE